MLMILTIGSLIGAFFFRSELGNFIIACAGAAIFSMYIVYDTQMMMGECDLNKFVARKSYIYVLNLHNFRWRTQIQYLARGVHFCCIKSLHGHYSVIYLLAPHSQIFEQ